VRVLFLSQIIPYPPHGGVLQRGYNLLRELGRAAEVHLLAYHHPDELPSEKVEESRRALLAFCDKVEYAPLWPKASSLHRAAALAMTTFSNQPFSVVAHRSAAFANLVAAALRDSPPDIVHVDTVALCPFAPPGSSAAPRVLTHHNIESILMARRAEAEPRAAARAFLRREAAKLRRYEAAVSPTFDLNVVVSPRDAEALAAIAPGTRTVLVPNGVDTEYFAPEDSPEEEALIYTGGLNMFANRDAVLHFLQEAWPRITSRRPRVRFFAVGQEPPPELQAIAAADPRVVVTGYVPDIRPFVRKAAVYVVPLRVGGGTRLKVLDAMALGKAMVSTSIGCEGIEVRAGEHLVIADTADAFADATVALLEDNERRRRLGRAARELVERRYGWRIIGASLIDAYRAAAEQRERVA
jgi:sugar transferase (PEP-CTERM/EpsH1 system associated)